MSISLRSRIRRACLLGCVSGAALLVPAVGQAAGATYPGGGSTFSGSAEGWKAESRCQLLSVLELPLLCTASGGYDGTAGAPAGSLATRTEIPLNLIGAFKSETVVDSPTFTALGGGAGSLGFSRAFMPGGLLGLNPQYAYTVNLVDKTTKSVQLLASETLEGEAPFASKTATLTLVAGDDYMVEIEATTSSSLASIGLLGGESIGRFDNVVVTGPEAEEETHIGNNGTNGQNGTNGKNGIGTGGTNGSSGSATNGSDGEDGEDAEPGERSGGKAGAVSAARLESMLRSSLTGPVTMHGSMLSVRANCPTAAAATCTISLQGLLTHKKAATAGRKARVKTAKTKNFAVTVKPAARATVKTKNKMLFKETVKVGASQVTAYRTLKLVRR